MRLVNAFTAIIRWLRAGYSQEAPLIGHSPLIALCGPTSLTQRQIQRILTQLDTPPGEAPTDVDIKVAITKVTRNLSSATDVRQIRAELAHRQP